MIATPPIERVAAITERLAVLIAGGVPPPAAWAYLAGGARRRSPPTLDDRVVAAATDAALNGASIADAIADRARAGAIRRSGRRSPASPEADAWLSVAAAWEVAIGTGAPLAGCLKDLARSQRALGQAQRDIEAALAGPRATSRLVMLLPAVGLVFGLLLGFDTIGTLFGTVPGLACLTVAVLLVLAAWRWSTAMVRRSIPPSSAPGLAVDLTSIAMSSGASVPRALSVVEAALSAYRPVAETVAADDRAAIDRVLALSQSAGVPAAELLRGEADQARRDARSAAQLGAASLAARLMLPLGLCILPAFMLVGVAPLMMSVLSSTVRGIG
ncbi:tight adherence protein B [Mycetocola sp. CAN_C7]|uniref:type II secretion system F family protein n=1 Tax=Mycetocola sp. CAN_C7 TaxID=2787724 RepID=UPI0018CA625B